jgi:hypothetical protein
LLACRAGIPPRNEPIISTTRAETPQTPRRVCRTTTGIVDRLRRHHERRRRKDGLCTLLPLTRGVGRRGSGGGGGWNWDRCPGRLVVVVVVGRWERHARCCLVFGASTCTAAPEGKVARSFPSIPRLGDDEDGGMVRCGHSQPLLGCLPKARTRREGIIVPLPFSVKPPSSSMVASRHAVRRASSVWAPGGSRPTNSFINSTVDHTALCQIFLENY